MHSKAVALICLLQDIRLLSHLHKLFSPIREEQLNICGALLPTGIMIIFYMVYNYIVYNFSHGIYNFSN